MELDDLPTLLPLVASQRLVSQERIAMLDLVAGCGRLPGKYLFLLPL